MGLASKLNAAFCTVIAVMVLTHAAYQLFSEYTTSHKEASRIVKRALDKLSQEIAETEKSNGYLASLLDADSSFRQAYTARDRQVTAYAVRSFIERSGLVGFVTIVDDKGKVFYASDTPAKFGYSLEGQSPEVSYVLAHNKWYGASCLSLTGVISIAGMVPITNGPNVIGLISVSQPLNTEFLTGLQKKLELSKERIQGIDLSLFSLKEGKVVAVTPGLVRSDGGFIAKLNREGMKALPAAEVESGGRIWRAWAMENPRKSLIALLLLTVPLPNITTKVIVIVGQAGVSAAIAFLLATLFVLGISRQFSASRKFLVERTKALAAHKPNIPSLDSLSSEWIELAEAVDTAIAAPRSSVQSLKGQMSRHAEEIQEKTQQIETANSQMEAVNRQLMSQSRQLAELSKQATYSTQQLSLLQQRLSSVLQVSTEGFLILDQYGNLLSANPVFLNWIGLSEEEVAGKLCFDLVKKPGESQNPEPLSTFSRHGNPSDLIAQFYPEGIIYNRQQDKVTEVLAHLHPVVADENNVAGYVMVLRDKSMHSEAARLRADIVSMLANSVRKPLVIAESKWSSLLATSTRESLNPVLGQAFIELHTYYQQLLGVVDSLLMLYGGYVPAESLKREQVSITRLVGDCLEHTAVSARGHQIILDYKTVTKLPTSAINSDIVRNALIQLLEKMISLTAPGGRVRVESTPKGNEIRLSISSSGPAVLQEEIEDMFAGFIEGKHREDTYSSRLTLYLVRNNIERIGGRIWAESEAGRGTTVYFTLPVQ